MIDKKSVTENFLTRNIVADVTQISNNSGMKYTKKHGRNPNNSGGEIISESKHLKGQLGPPSVTKNVCVSRKMITSLTGL